MTPDHQIMFDQNHEQVLLKVLITHLFALINDGGVVAEIEIESLFRTRGWKGRRRNERGEIEEKRRPHKIRFSCRTEGSGN